MEMNMEKLVFPEEVKKDLLKSDIPIEEVVKVGWSTPCPTADKLKELLGFVPSYLNSINHILVFPYYNQSGEIIYNRVKLYPPIENTRYLSPKDKKPHLYIFPEDWKKLASPKTKFLIVEGEKKWLKLRLELPQPPDFNYVVIGISGITCWNADEWKKIDLIGRDIYLCFDADGEDNKDVRREEIKLYAYLKNKGAKVKSLVWQRKEGRGIDDYLVSSPQPKENLQKLIQQLIQQAVNPLQKYADRPYVEVTDALKKVRVNARTHKILTEEIKQHIREGKALRITSIGKDIIHSKEAKRHFPESQADSLIELLKELREKGVVSYFHDETKETWARVRVDKHWENYPVKSRYFRQFARKVFYQVYNKAINNDALNTALSNLEATLPYDLEEHKLNIRIAQKDGNIFYSLCNKNWQAVKITPQGWEIINTPPVFFKQLPHQKPQVIPNKNGDVNTILDFLNLKDKDARILAIVWLVASFIPDIPHPIPVLYGSQGAGKSFFFKLLREIIDPSVLSLLSLSKDKTELTQVLSHHYFAPYDNLTSLSDWASDVFSRAVTGEGNTKRKLYTDDEDVVYSYQRCIGLNGINCVALKPDLLDRSILIELQRIPRNERKEEKELWEKFNKVKPKILGGVFNVLSQAFSIYPTVNLDALPRMADFSHYGYAIAEALGIGGEQFLQAYYNNIKTQNEQVIEGNPVASCLMEFMGDKSDWEGTASELLEELNKVAEELKINLNSKSWVKTPQLLARKLNTLRTNLEEVGIDFSKGWNGKKRIISLSLKEEENTVGIVGSVGNPVNTRISAPTIPPMIPTISNNTVGNSVSVKPTSDKASVDTNDTDDKIPTKRGA